VKYAWVDQHRDVFALSEMCAVLDVSIAGYRAWQKGGKPHRKRLTDSQMLFHIQVIHAEVKEAYGSPRMVKELRSRGLPAGKDRVERLMQENGIYGKHKRKYKVTTDSKHRLPVAPNLLNRQFKPELPNQAWVSDITYLWTDEGWLYLAIVMDLFNREIVGFSIKPRMTTDLISDALTMAWFRRRPQPGLMVHSDRGSQYCSNTYQTKLKGYGMVCSMSRKGNCWDNAPAESWFGSFKNEAIYGNHFATRELMKATCFDYIEVQYNRKRLHSSLGYQSPKQYLQNWLANRGEMLVA
jgi:putative transposase